MKRAGSIALGVTFACAAWASDSAWTGAADQDWNTAANWSTLSVPGSGDSAFLTNSAGAFTVFVSNAPAAAVGSLTISNASASATTLQLSAPLAVQAGTITLGKNGALDFENGGVLSYWGEVPGAPFFSVANGGEIRINSGGGLLLTNLYSATRKANRYFYLGNRSEGRMLIGDGGTFAMGAADNTNIVLYLGCNSGGNGLLQMTGSSTCLMTRCNRGAVSFYVGNGAGSSGTVSLADSAKCVISNLAYIGGTDNATGILTLAGNSLFRVNNGGQYYCGNGSKAYGEVVLRDNALFDGSGTDDQQISFGRTGGTGKLTVYGGAIWIQNFFHVGYNGTGYLTLTNGFVYAMGQYNRGLDIGVADGTGNAAYGNLTISGGTLSVSSDPGQYSVEAFTGLQIGKTLIKTSSTTTSRAYSEMTLSGGIVTNRAYFFVGQGMNATGIVVQTGGTVVHGVGTTGERAFIGFGGGYGSYTLSNGTYRALKDVYVGGYPDSMWPPTLFDVNATNHWNAYANFYTNKIAYGVLRIAGGLFAASNATIRVGGQGVGTLVIGQDAACVAKNIILDTNTSSTVRFEFGADGIGTLQATNQITICPGARLEVDTSACPWRAVWTKLIDCASRAGAFSPENITVTGEGTVRQDRDEDVWLFRPRGTLISVF